MEDIEGFAGVVGFGDDTDQVLVASAGGTDIQALAGGRTGGEGDGTIGGVGLVAGLGRRVAELDVFGHVLLGRVTVPCPSMRVTVNSPVGVMVLMVQ